MQPSDNIKVHRVPVKAVIRAIRVPAVAELFNRGLAAAGEDNIRLVIADLLTEHRQLWLVFGAGEPKPLACWITNIQTAEDGRKWLCVSALAGRKMGEWVAKVADTMEAFAKREGCVCFRWAGKRAWRRAVPNARVVGRVSDSETCFERAVQ